MNALNNPKKDQCDEINRLKAIIADLQLSQIKSEQREKDLNKYKDKFQSLAQSAIDAIITINTNGQIIFFNKAAEDMFGHTTDEIIEQNVTVLIPDNMKSLHSAGLKRYLETTKSVVMGKTLELFGQRKNGDIFPIELSLSEVVLGDERLFNSIIRDITIRKEMEAALKESEFRYQCLFEDSPMSLWEEDFSEVRIFLDKLKDQGVCDFREYFDNHPDELVDCAKKIKVLDVNKATLGLHQAKSKEELLGYLDQTFTPKSYDVFKEELITLAENGVGFESETEVKSLTGEHRDILIRFSVSQMGQDGKNKERALIAINDITERKRTDLALIESEKKLIEAQRIAKLGHFTLNTKTGYWTSSVVLNEIFGIEDNYPRNSQSLIDIVHSEFQESLILCFRDFVIDKNNYFDKQYKIINQQTGEEKWVHNLGTLRFDEHNQSIEMFGTIQDISIRKQMEEEKNSLELQLRRAQKLETIGTMAGGIAHDFNNILTPIMGYTELVMSIASPKDKLFRNMNHILKASYRAKDLVEQILLFSKQKEKERKPVALHLIVKEVLKLIRPSIPTTIEIRQEINEQCEKVFVDATQIHQVIVNLCTNAWHSMEKSGGILTIKMNQVSLESDMKSMYPNLIEPQYICVSASDTGIGMNKETLNRIFDPFFTTKAVNKGTGMGLAVVHGIVQSHHGEIIVESEPGQGATFHVYLPIAQSNQNITPSQPDDDELKIGNETILVVDDESMVADLVKHMLHRVGYQVDVLSNSLDVLHMIEQNPDKYDVLIADLTMPHMTGLELAEQMVKQKIDIPVIIMTGYDDDIILPDNPGHIYIKKILRKPLMMKELTDTVRSVLDIMTNTENIPII